MSSATSPGLRPPPTPRQRRRGQWRAYPRLSWQVEQRLAQDVLARRESVELASPATFAPMPLDPGIAALLEMIANSGYPPTYQGTPETARKAHRALACGTVTPEAVVPVGKVEEFEAGGRPARSYLPEGAGPWPTLVYFHGGGFVTGDLDTGDQTCRRICRDADTAVLAIDYRLAPEHPFPAAVDDAIAAVRWAADHQDELGGGAVLAVGGDSAGGNLAAVTAQALPHLLDAQILICPATHLLGDYRSRVDNAEGYLLDWATCEWFSTHYLGAAEDLDDARLSPMLGDPAGTPPALVTTAEFDPLRDEGEGYADRLAAAEVPVDRIRYDGLIHGYNDIAAVSEAAAAALDDTIARIRTLLHR